jgi:hypothetical protein
MINFNSVNKNRLQNFVGGLLFGYGFVTFFLFIYLVNHWAYLAPVNADTAHGFIFPHNQHGSITYFSAFQSTSCSLLPLTSLPISILGWFILPKKYIKYMKNRFAFRMTFEPDDKIGLSWWGIGIGGILAPVIFLYRTKYC